MKLPLHPPRRSPAPLRWRVHALRALATDTRGAIFVEYISLVVLVTLIAALAIAALGVPLIHQYEMAKLLLTAPIP